jgi:hypothetical protein
MLTSAVIAKPPKTPTKAKFYDFSEQLIDGHIRRPTALYTDARKRVKFDRLLRLKKSFIKELFDTAKLPVFK